MKLSVKKLLGLILASSMTFSLLTGCGSKESTDIVTDKDAVITQAPVEETETETTPEPTQEPAKDLGGMEITIGNWWEQDPPAPPATQQEEDTLAYRNEIMKKHNFNIKTVNLGTWGEYQEIMVTSTMSGDPAADIFIMDTQFVSAPLSQGLLYPLNTLENFDFTDEKWNQQVLEMMKLGDDTYGMATGRMEPRLGVFWNKRLFEEAGIDPELPYDLQASGEWTWEAFEEMAEQLTRDINNDGTPDVYGTASFSVEFFKGAVFSNNAKFIGKDDSGKFYNATNEANFIEAVQWARSFFDNGTHMPEPEGANWDWFIAAFKEGKVAMQAAEQYKVGTWADMQDDWGFVIFPKGPKGEMMTVFNENIVVMPVSLEKEDAENIAFAYNLFTETTPGYEDVDWRTNYYASFRDGRAVDETLPLFYDPKHGTLDLIRLIDGIDHGDLFFDVAAGAVTPAEGIEALQQKWQSFIDGANGVETE
ncbi:extracellular solute-binding protein [Mobilitalea sibirica]|uniref:Extracellular solute-binding protein n=1 Tax=Mobilitalea sibirica TaxID=1462919 RepID=A0A8J7KW47_9FIRM|nr:extracellular solute-binding protein [Mobilitalea sibirica]MBH1940930.1 extracellular solute-binding protein [Mobilitalea sibirica]